MSICKFFILIFLGFIVVFQIPFLNFDYLLSQLEYSQQMQHKHRARKFKKSRQLQNQMK
jgi:hypothetical protein